MNGKDGKQNYLSPILFCRKLFWLIRIIYERRCWEQRHRR